MTTALCVCVVVVGLAMLVFEEPRRPLIAYVAITVGLIATVCAYVLGALLWLQAVPNALVVLIGALLVGMVACVFKGMAEPSFKRATK